jgi:hypothetical protein
VRANLPAAVTAKRQTGPVRLVLRFVLEVKVLAARTVRFGRSGKAESRVAGKPLNRRMEQEHRSLARRASLGTIEAFGTFRKVHKTR